MPSLPNTLSDAEASHVSDLLAAKPFDEPNITQRTFLEEGGLDRENTLLVAQTGNGKTACAEMRTQKALANGKTIAYLVPSRQLTNGKYESITEWVDTDRYTVTNATSGETSGYNYADVIVATFESYFEAVMRDVDDRIDLVVLDDFHELYSGFRGPTIESVISAAKYHGVELLAMSATIGNAQDIADWLDATLIESPAERGVPIREDPVEVGEQKYGALIGDIINRRPDDGPFLVFNYSKSNAEARAKEIARQTSFPAPEEDYGARIEDAISTTLTERHEDLIDLLEEGVAFHHADLDSATKAIVEEAVKVGDVKCLTATTTVAYGFDAPIQTVIIADLKRGWGYRREWIGKFEYVQWVGRAGRSSERYDEAYAIPLYKDEDAFDRFEFGTQVEAKSLEDMRSHIGVADKRAMGERDTDADEADEHLRWLLLELVNGGWQTRADLLNFTAETLYAHQVRQQGDGSHLPEALVERVGDGVSWLERKGFLEAQDRGQTTVYAPTQAGDAAFEFRHSTWVDSSLSELRELIKWIDSRPQIRPEGLVSKIAETYWECDLNTEGQAEGYRSQLEMHNLDPDTTADHTAAIVCWYWCDGIPVDRIERYVEASLSSLAGTARHNIAGVLDALGHLFPATNTTQPDWLTTFSRQVRAGVTRADLLLADIKGVARGRITSIDQRALRGLRDLDEDYRPCALSDPVIVKLAGYRDHRDGEDEFIQWMMRADHVGKKYAKRIANNLPDDIGAAVEREPEVPFQTSARDALFGGSGSPSPDGDNDGDNTAAGVVETGGSTDAGTGFQPASAFTDKQEDGESGAGSGGNFETDGGEPTGDSTATEDSRSMATLDDFRE